MKSELRFGFLWLFCLFLCAGAEDLTDEPMRVWSNANGNRIAGRLLSFGDNQVKIQFGDKAVVLKLEELSIEDRSYLLERFGRDDSPDEKNTAENPHDKSSAKAEPTIADRATEIQRQFLKINHESILAYDRASNPLKRSLVRTERSGKFKALLPTRSVSQWVGRISEMSTDKARDAVVVVKIDDEKILITNLGKRISHDSDLYRKFAEFDVGDLVLVSGRFLEGADEFIDEVSFTESGSIRDPKFNFEFESVSEFK